MRNILSYKLYEGVYSDTMEEISIKKREIDALRSNYFSEVSNCLVDITDNWEPSYFGYPRDTENGLDYGEYEIACEVVLKRGDMGKFLDKFDDVRELVKSYIGIDAKIETVWSPSMSGYNNFDDYSSDLNKSDVKDMKLMMSKFLDENFIDDEEEISVSFSIC